MATRRELLVPDAASSSEHGPADTAIAALARRAIASYRTAHRKRYLDTLFRLQDLAGRPRDALASLRAFDLLGSRTATPRVRHFDSGYAIYESAKARADGGEPFDRAYEGAFKHLLASLDNKDAAAVLNGLSGVDLDGAMRALFEIRQALANKSPIGLDDVVALLRAEYDLRVAQMTDQLSRQLISDEDQRRWIVRRNVLVHLSDGATICAMIVRPRSAAVRAPTALQFTIYADPDALMREARWAAGYGYVAVMGLTRGKGCGPGKPEPYRHDGEDADALIRWVAAQPWSDGQVGLYGGSYSGFTAWASLKHPPRALKAIDVGAAASPGIDVPMEGNIVWMFVYPWPFYTTDNKLLDTANYNDNARWQRLQSKWYESGRPFRDLDKIDGTPNPVWDEWLHHPAYDSYWRSAIPTAAQLATVRIPILQTAGYYYGGPGAAVWYLQRQYRANRNARSYLLIGPYGHLDAQRGFLGSLVGAEDRTSGLELDHAALVDLVDLRFAWFDHFMKGGPMPALIRDRINYEVVGANTWKHVASINAMGPIRARFYLSTDRGGTHSLQSMRSRSGSWASLKVDLADRTDGKSRAQGAIRDRRLNTANGLLFISGPFATVTEASGLFSGHLEFVTNKRDFDAEIDLYELTSNGDYVQLAPWWTRMSYSRDSGRRELLTPGRREIVGFKATHLMSRRMARGSRLVALIRVIKETGRQINHGTGKDINDESAADAGEPLTIRLSSRCWIELPVARPRFSNQLSIRRSHVG